MQFPQSLPICPEHVTRGQAYDGRKQKAVQSLSGKWYAGRQAKGATPGKPGNPRSSPSEGEASQQSGGVRSELGLQCPSGRSIFQEWRTSKLCWWTHPQALEQSRWESGTEDKAPRLSGSQGALFIKTMVGICHCSVAHTTCQIQKYEMNRPMLFGRAGQAIAMEGRKVRLLVLSRVVIEPFIYRNHDKEKRNSASCR